MLVFKIIKTLRASVSTEAVIIYYLRNYNIISIGFFVYFLLPAEKSLNIYYYYNIVVGYNIIHATTAVCVLMMRVSIICIL